MGVRLADDPHARPAGVAEHGSRLRGDSSARRSSVSSTIAARSAAVLSPSSPISAAALYTNDRTTVLSMTVRDWNSGSTPRSSTNAATTSGIDVVIPDEHVQPRRVAPAHLEAIDRRQRLLDRQVAAGRLRVPASRPASSPTSRAVRSRSWRIAHSASFRAIRSALACFQRRRVEAAGRVVVRVEPGFDIGGEGVELIEAGHDRRRPVSTRAVSASTPGRPRRSASTSAAGATAGGDVRAPRPTPRRDHR